LTIEEHVPVPCSAAACRPGEPAAMATIRLTRRRLEQPLIALFPN
jgi:hypothetical protein